MHYEYFLFLTASGSAAGQFIAGGKRLKAGRRGATPHRLQVLGFFKRC